jgi:hypothetical protein
MATANLCQKQLPTDSDAVWIRRRFLSRSSIGDDSPREPAAIHPGIGSTRGDAW